MAAPELVEQSPSSPRAHTGRRWGRKRLLLAGSALLVVVGTPVAAAAGLAGSEQPENLQPKPPGAPTQVQGPAEKPSVDGADAPGGRTDTGGVDGADAPGDRDD